MYLQIFGIQTHKNVPDWQHSAHFKKSLKVLITPPSYMHQIPCLKDIFCGPL